MDILLLGLPEGNNKGKIIEMSKHIMGTDQHKLIHTLWKADITSGDQKHGQNEGMVVFHLLKVHGVPPKKWMYPVEHIHFQSASYLFFNRQ